MAANAVTAAPLDAIIRELRLHAEAALVRRLNAGSGFADPRVPSQIYLRDAAALARLAGGTLRPQGTHRDAAAELERAIAAAGAHDAHATRLGVMTTRLGLDAAAGGLLAAAVAYALDLDTRELCHALAPRRRPALYVETCADVLGTETSALVRATALGGPLRRGRLLAIDGDGLAATIELAGPALAWLLGDEALPPPLAGLVELVRPRGGSRRRAARRRRSRRSTRWPPGSGRRRRRSRRCCAGPAAPAAAPPPIALPRALGRPLLVIPVPALVALEQRAPDVAARDRARRGAPARRRAATSPTPRRCTTSAASSRPSTLDAIAGTPGVMLASIDRPRWPPRAAPPGPAGRDAARRARRSRARVGVGADAARRRGRRGRARRALRDRPGRDRRRRRARPRASPRPPGPPSTSPTLEGAVGRRLSLRLGTFGAVVHRKARFAELVLPDDVIDTLHDMIAMVRERSQILERWGYQRHLGISRGVSGAVLGRARHRQDDGGERGRVGARARARAHRSVGGGLEVRRRDREEPRRRSSTRRRTPTRCCCSTRPTACSASAPSSRPRRIGSRTSRSTTSSSGWRRFDGVSVLTTNAENAIDPALQRRLNFRIRFPEPELDERERLWRQLLPPSTGLHDGVDFHALAERFDMTGRLHQERGRPRRGDRRARRPRDDGRGPVGRARTTSTSRWARSCPSSRTPSGKVGPMTDAPRKDNRLLSIGLAVLAAGLLIVAALSRHWLANPAMNDLGFGPMGCANCCLPRLEPGCGMSNGAFVDAVRAADPVHSADQTSGAFAPTGWITFGLCLIAALGLLAAAFVAFRNRRPELPIAPASIALLAIIGAMISGCVFVATKPGRAGFVGVNSGFWAFGIGLVLGIVAAQQLAKVIRPVDPDLLEDAMNPDQY